MMSLLQVFFSKVSLERSFAKSLANKGQIKVKVVWVCRRFSLKTNKQIYLFFCRTYLHGRKKNNYLFVSWENPRPTNLLTVF